MSELRRLVTSSGAYALIPLTGSVLSAVVVPLYTHVLTPTEYGVVSLIGAGIALLAVVTVLGLDTATARWFTGGVSGTDQRQTVASWTAAQTALATAFAMLLLIFAEPLSTALTGHHSAVSAVRWAALILPLNATPTVAMTVLRLQNRRTAAIALGIVNVVGTIAASAALVVGARWGPAGVFAGQDAGYLVTSALSVALLGGWLSPRSADWARLGKMLRFALPLVPAAGAAWMANLLDRYVIHAVSGSATVGVYQVAYAVAGLVALATSGFQLAWGPFAFGMASDPRAKDLYARAMLGYVAMTAILLASVGVAAPTLLHLLVPSSYADAASAVPLLGLSYVFIGLTYVAAIGPSIAGTSSPVAVGTLIAGSATVPLLVLLVPGYGLLGAAVATAIAWGTQPAWVFWRGHSLWRVEYPYLRAGLILAAATALAQGLNEWRTGPIFVLTATKVVALAALTGGILVTAGGRSLFTRVAGRVTATGE